MCLHLLVSDLTKKSFEIRIKKMLELFISGEDRLIDVIDVHSQEAIVMNIREFCEAFETPVEDRPTVLNCLSLEVTNLPLGDVVMPPLVARMLCWVTNVWPQSIQEQWEGGEPPQVQKYCIMSMQGAFTGILILKIINRFYFTVGTV